jgi:pimeloyl-ACP methyl ester carboxylesterase
MLLPLDRRNIAYDLVGPENAPVVCMTHSLASDGGMWTEQVPALLQAGFRVLRIDMRGHGGSGAMAGDYTMSALASDVAAVVEALAIQRVHFIGLSIGGMLGQALPWSMAASWHRPCGATRCPPRRPVRRRCGSSASIRYAARIRSCRWLIRRSSAGSPMR